MGSYARALEVLTLLLEELRQPLPEFGHWRCLQSCSLRCGGPYADTPGADSEPVVQLVPKVVFEVLSGVWQPQIDVVTKRWVARFCRDST
jgi:hypothetical protein